MLATLLTVIVVVVDGELMGVVCRTDVTALLALGLNSHGISLCDEPVNEHEKYRKGETDRYENLHATDEPLLPATHRAVEESVTGFEPTAHARETVPYLGFHVSPHIPAQ